MHQDPRSMMETHGLTPEKNPEVRSDSADDLVKTSVPHDWVRGKPTSRMSEWWDIIEK